MVALSSMLVAAIASTYKRCEMNSGSLIPIRLLRKRPQMVVILDPKEIEYT